MIKSLSVFVGLIAAQITVLGYAQSAATEDKAQDSQRRERLVIGKVSDDPRKHYPHLKPIVDYAAAHLKDLGIERGEVLLAINNAQMIQYLKEGRVDWVTEGVFSALLFAEKGGAEILLRRWRDGVPEYHTVFITRKDSAIRRLEDLKGRKLALGDPGSTTAFFVPIAVLAERSLGLAALASFRDVPPTDQAGYVFAGSEVNVAAWVHKGLVDAGAYSNLDWEDQTHTPIPIRQDLHLFHRSQPFPRAVELVRAGLSPAIKKRLKGLLLHAHTDPEAAEALKAYEKTTQFDEITGEAALGLAEARRLFLQIRAVLD